MTVSGPVAAPVAAQVSVVAQQMLAQREAFIKALVEVTRSEIRELDHDQRLRSLLEASITENIVAAVNFLGNATSLDDLDAPTAALAYARTLAQRDVPLSALIRAYRIGHSRFLDAALGLVATSATDRMDVVMHFVRRSAEYIDKVCEQVGRSYEAERDRWVSSRSGLRQQFLNEVLQGATADLRQAEETLSYSFEGTHVAVGVWPEDDVAGFDVVKLFDDVRHALGPALTSTGPYLLVPHDEREVRIWFTVRPGTVPDAARLTDALSSAGLAAHVAVGDPGTGVEGFRRTLRQAERVKEIKLARSGAHPAVVTHRQVAPVALLTEDVAEVAQFVTSRLGRLAIDDDRTGGLRDTLRVFLDLHRSYASAAQAMMLHRNSIQYRVRQALDLCEQDLDEPGVAFELLLALTAARWLGPSVLTKA